MPLSIICSIIQGEWSTFISWGWDTIRRWGECEYVRVEVSCPSVDIDLMYHVNKKHKISQKWAGNIEITKIGKTNHFETVITIPWPEQKQNYGADYCKWDEWEQIKFFSPNFFDDRLTKWPNGQLGVLIYSGYKTNITFKCPFFLQERYRLGVWE